MRHRSAVDAQVHHSDELPPAYSRHDENNGQTISPPDSPAFSASEPEDSPDLPTLDGPPIDERRDSPLSDLPPAYHKSAPTHVVDDLTTGFANLHLHHPEGLTRDQCTAHLKFLECLYQLRRRVAMQDGLFGIRDPDVLEIPGDAGPTATSRQRTDDAYALVGEKRWAVYVAKAADRFEQWRDAVVPSGQYITVKDCTRDGRLGTTFQRRVDSGRLLFQPEHLPPIGE